LRVRTARVPLAGRLTIPDGTTPWNVSMGAGMPTLTETILTGQR
jgi:hypothetical protein